MRLFVLLALPMCAYAADCGFFTTGTKKRMNVNNIDGPLYSGQAQDITWNHEDCCTVRFF